jgi:hypothetical protein
MYIGLHERCPSFPSDFNETWIFFTDYQKYTKIEFDGNLSSGNRLVPCGQTDRQTDMTKL